MTTPLVLLHPLGADRHFWDPVRDALGPHPAVALDLPGHGSAPLADGAGIEAYADAVVRAVAKLAEPVCLVGMSLGGLVAQHIGWARPDLVASVVLVDTVAVYPDAMRQMWRDRAAVARHGDLSSLIEPMVTMWFTTGFADSGSGTVATARKAFGSTNPEGYARACELLAEVDLRDQVQALSVPAIAVCGEDDAPAFRDGASWLAHATGGGAVRLLPGKHACCVEHPDEFAALLTTTVR